MPQDRPLALDAHPAGRFADSLTARVNDGDLIDTSNVNLCGPGAFFRNMAQDYPFLYAAIAMELYDKGRSSFFSFNIKGNDKLYRWKPSGKVDPARLGRPRDVSGQREYRLALQL